MESINSDLVNGCQQSDDSLKCDIDFQTKLIESEDKLQKFKGLAIKLKKELKDTKEQLSKSLSESNELKTELKSIEKEQKSSSYQQIVRNFQSLQSEYDKLQDQSDSLSAKNKELERNLAENLNELTKTIEELRESKEEIEVLKTNINCFKEEKQYLDSRKKELESKVIILENDLELEHKKNVSNTGLEQTITELRHHLSAKTNEIIDLSDRLEKANQELTNFNQLFNEKQELISRIQNLEKENFNFKEDINKYNETIETQLSEIEDYKIRCSETSARIHSLETQLKSSNETFNTKIRSLETKVTELQTYISDMEVELKKKDLKYEEYRNRVCKVLKQNGSQTNERNSKKIEALETTIDTLNSELNSLKEKQKIILTEKESLENSFDELNSSQNSLKNQIKESEQTIHTLRERINEFKIENEKLKALSRELQFSLVNDHKQTEALHKSQIKQIEDKHKSEIVLLNEELSKTNNELKELKLEIKRLRNCDQMSEYFNKSHQSISTSDDLESVETISLSEKKVSISPTSMSGNLLKEILFSKETPELKPTQDFTKHLTIAQNKVQNLTQLLEESESNNNLMSEQNRVLKEEIRRLQRSIDRIEVADNLEYLKNIIVKFISFNSDDERQRLLPVLATILKLSPEEQNLFQAFASIDQNTSNNKWTGYLYQWSPTNK